MTSEQTTPVFDALKFVPLNSWIPWTAAQSLVRFHGKSISSDHSRYQLRTQVINNQTCVRWGDAWDKATPSRSMARAADIKKQIEDLIVVYRKLMEKNNQNAGGLFHEQ